MRLPDPESSRAVLIGTSHYLADPGLDPLPAVGNNLAALAALLTDGGLTGLPRSGCTVLTDPPDARQVGLALQEAADAADDLLLVYYAGHGLVDTSGDLHLALSTTTREALRYSAVPYEWVRQTLVDSQAANRVVIIDCCFSGRAIGAQADPASIVAGQIDIEGAFTLTSASRNSTSQAPPGANFTAFTGELIRLLREGIPLGPPYLTLDTLYDELRRTTRRKGLPAPQAARVATANQLALARNSAHEPRQTEAADQPSASAQDPKPASTADPSSTRRVPRRWRRLSTHMLAVLFTATVAVVPVIPEEGCVPSAGIRQAANDECVGVTDGSFIFNPRLIRIEQRIKALNDQVIASGKPYVTIVYLGPLTADPTTRPQQDLLASAQGELVGLSIAQQNRNRNGTPPGVRILLANTGSKMRYAQQVAQEIRTRTLNDRHIVGVVGFEQSRQQTQQAIAEIAQAGLPMIGTANSYDNTARYQGGRFSPLYFRLAPPNSRLAAHAAYWARIGLTGVHARTVTVIYDGDPADLYSKNLADDFSHDFGPNNVTEMGYTRPGDLPSLVARACEHPPDLFYYVGRSDEFGAFLHRLTDITCGNGQSRVLADDEIATYVNDNATDIGDDDTIRLYYTPLALREAWTPQQVGHQPVPRFFNDYDTIVRQTFGPNPPPDIRPSLTRAAVSYDAMLIFTSVTAKIFGEQGIQPTPAAVLDALIEPSHVAPQQGASGQLSFGSSDTGHQVHDKPVLLATVRPDGTQEVLAVCGHLAPSGQRHLDCPPQDR